MPFVLAGLRRGLLDTLQRRRTRPTASTASTPSGLEPLSDEDARTLVERLALHAARVTLNDETRDLVVQQFAGNPFLHLVLHAGGAARAASALTSFRDCQRLYVDELLGGRINRRFNHVLEEIAPAPSTRRALVRVLYDSAMNAGGKSPAEAWRRRLELEPERAQPVMNALHMHELASFNATFMEMSARHGLARLPAAPATACKSRPSRAPSSSPRRWSRL